MTVATGMTISERIEGAFNTASRSTGTSFDYLVRTASRESAFNPQAQAKTSSASGLFQFIESTWLEMIKEAGPHLGLERYAQHIERAGNGQYRVQDAEKRAEILKLRHDPETSALMAGAYTKRNAGDLSERLGRPPTQGELYIAHFLGARGAAKLITAAENNPQQNASNLFPRQARANRGVFYGNGGDARTTSEVYRSLVKQHGGEPVMVAKPELASAPAANDIPAARVLMTAFAPPTQAAQRVQQGWQAVKSEEPFSVLFRTDASVPRDPVGPTFWSAFASSPDMMAAPGAEKVDSAPQQQLAPNPVQLVPDSGPGQRPASEPVQAAHSNSRQPLNLTEFLGYKLVRGPRNLLPPA